MNKKLILLVLALFAAIFSFISCGGSANNQAANESDTTKAEVQVAETPVVIDTLRTPDLALFDLQGPVDKISNGKGDFFIAAFDKQGRIISIGSTNWDNKLSVSYEGSESGKVTASGGHNVKRDNEGRVLSISAGSGCGDAPGYYFKYAKGRISEYHYAWGECTGDVYHEVSAVDEQGRIINEKSGWGDELGYEEVTTTFTYTKVDEWGNWTERSYKQNIVSEDYESDEEGIVKRSSKSGTETRTIVYY